MFKVDDTVVPIGNNWGKYPNAILVVELDGDMHFKGRNFTGLEREYWYMVKDWRLATPEETKHKCRIDEEIAAGHRIDLETLHDCDTSPNCKKFDERVGHNETN